MIDKQKRKRIFYVPGMISLIFIPLFCLVHFYRTDAFKVYGGIDFTIDDNYFEKNPVTERRKYKTFNFNETEAINTKKLKEMRFYLHELIAKKDTINGIIAHLDSKNKYDFFINLLEVLNEENPPVYGLYKNDFYIWGYITPRKIKKDENVHMMTCIPVVEVIDDSLEREAKLFQTSFFKQKWILLSLGYFGLVLLNIFVLVKFHKNK